MRLGAPLRGVIYGIGGIAAAVTWLGGQRWQAVGIGAMVVTGVVLEALNEVSTGRN